MLTLLFCIMTGLCCDVLGESSSWYSQTGRCSKNDWPKGKVDSVISRLILQSFWNFTMLHFWHVNPLPFQAQKIHSLYWLSYTIFFRGQKKSWVQLQCLWWPKPGLDTLPRHRSWRRSVWTWLTSRKVSCAIVALPWMVITNLKSQKDAL